MTQTITERRPNAVWRRARRPSSEVVIVGSAAVALALITGIAVQWGLDHHVVWDLPFHAQNAAIAERQGTPWPYPLPYWMMSASCGFCANGPQMTRRLPPLSALLFAIKFVISYVMLRTGLGFRSPGHRSKTQVAVLVAGALFLGLAFSLPFPNLFRGQMPPNQWHNTTTWVLLPFALWTFWAACNYMREPTNSGAVWVAIAGVLSVLAKPSFAIAFVPAFPIQLQLSSVPRRWKRVGLAATAVVAVALLVQYEYMYHSHAFDELRRAVLSAQHRDPNVKWGLRIAPFSTWSRFSPFIPLSIVSMVLFPVAAVFARPGLARKSRELSFAWLLFVVALLQYVVFEETGRTDNFRNLHWGAIVTLYIVFLVSVAMMLDPRRKGVIPRRDTIAWGAFALHVLSGAFVLFIFAATGSYWWTTWSQVWSHL